MNRDPSGRGPNVINGLDCTAVLAERDRVLGEIEFTFSEGPFNPQRRSREFKYADEHQAIVVDVSETIDDYGWCLTVRDSELFHETTEGAKTIKTVTYMLSDDDFRVSTRFTNFDSEGQEVAPNVGNTMTEIWKQMYQRARDIIHETAGQEVLNALHETEARQRRLEDDLSEGEPSKETLHELEAVNMEIATVHEMYAADDSEYEALREKFDEARRLLSMEAREVPGTSELKAMQSFMAMLD